MTRTLFQEVSGAVFDPTRTFRFWLWRAWGDETRRVLFIESPRRGDCRIHPAEETPSRVD